MSVHVDSLLLHFLQQFLNLPILLVNLIMQVLIILLQDLFLILQLFQALDVSVDLIGLEVDFLPILNLLLLEGVVLPL